MSFKEKLIDFSFCTIGPDEKQLTSTTIVYRNIFTNIASCGQSAYKFSKIGCFYIWFSTISNSSNLIANTILFTLNVYRFKNSVAVPAWQGNNIIGAINILGNSGSIDNLSNVALSKTFTISFTAILESTT